MTALSQEVRLPDIGDFTDVDVIELLVSVGESVQAEQSLLTIESEKSALEIPSPISGKVTTLHAAIGDKVSAGSLIATIELSVQNEIVTPAKNSAQTTTPKTQVAVPPAKNETDLHAELLVIGGGPGGYTAAFRAADLGMQVTLIERYPDLGGVCLNVGCIPSKTLLHAAKVISDVDVMQSHGLKFSPPEIDLPALRKWKSSIVKQLTSGLNTLAKKRNVTVIQGVANFISPDSVKIERLDETQLLRFKKAIIAVGSTAIRIPGIPYEDPRIMDSTSALEIDDIPKRLLIMGGGIIGLEMATVYAALGSKVTIAELADQLVPGVDTDLAKPLTHSLKKKDIRILLNTEVTMVTAEKGALNIELRSSTGVVQDDFDKLLVAVGRRANGRALDLEHAHIPVTAKGLIEVNKHFQTTNKNIYAIGDCTAGPMLAHKATHEAKIAAEHIAGHKVAFDAKVIPSVAYTDPELAWVGLSEEDAKTRGIAYEKAIFPWEANGRALSLGEKTGLTKLLFSPNNKQLLGAAIFGANAGDLIAEATLAIEMGCEADDIALTIHPHPTLSETIAMSAEGFLGTLTDLYLPK